MTTGTRTEATGWR